MLVYQRVIVDEYTFSYLQQMGERSRSHEDHEGGG